MSATRKRNNRSGQAVVEASLTLLVFLAILIGIMDFGQFLYYHQSLSERARAGARYAAVHGTDATHINSTQIANFTLYNDAAGAGGGGTPVAALLPFVNDPGASTPDSTMGTITATLLNGG